MLKKALSVILAAALVSAPYSCSDETSVEPRENEERILEDPWAELAGIEAELGEAPEVRELLAMLEEAAGRMADRGSAIGDSCGPRASGKAAVAAAQLYSEDDAELFRERLAALRDSLLTRFPVLRRCVEDAAGAGCGAAAPKRTGEDNGIPADPPVKGSRPVECKWGPFVVAMMACANAAIAAGGNPGIYFACAYQVLCSYCWGGWVDRICS